MIKTWNFNLTSGDLDYLQCHTHIAYILSGGLESSYQKLSNGESQGNPYHQLDMIIMMIFEKWKNYVLSVFYLFILLYENKKNLLSSILA